jgi:hypothetical protein
LIVGTVAIGCGGNTALKHGDGSVSDGPAERADGKPVPPMDAGNDAPMDAPSPPPLDATDAKPADGKVPDAPPTDVPPPPTDTKPTDAPPTDTKPTDTKPADGGDAGGGPFVPGAGSKLIVGGTVQLIGSGTDTCTNQVPATGDRWCAFAKVSATTSASELWVVNVSKLAANVPVTCDTTDANCLRLSRALFQDPTNGFRIDGFDGDTLTYSELPSSSDNSFLGVVSAWRPGWPGGRPLTSNAGVVCNSHRTSRAELCLEKVGVNAAGDTTGELHAGLLDTPTGGTLPFVDTVLIAGAADAPGVQKWQASITPDGARVAWSTRATSAGPESLKVQTIGDDTSRLAIASDVSRWAVTSDSSKWLWLSGYNYDDAAPSGTLQSAAFPGGAGVQTLATAVGDFKEAGTKGVLYRSAVGPTGLGKLVLAPDRDAPATVTMLDQGVAFVFEVSPDGTRATYTKNIQSPAANVFLFDLWLSGAGGAAPCAMASSAIAFIPPRFVPGGSLAAWGRFNSPANQVEGVYTTTSDCATHKFASNFYTLAPVAGQASDEGYVYLDDVNPDPNVFEATLRYAKVANGALPATGTSIQARAGLVYAPLLPSLPAVLYVVTTSGPGDGLYLNATLPFTTTP